MAGNWSSGPDWVPGVIVEQLGPLTFQVRTQQSQLWKRHVHYLRKSQRNSELPISESQSKESESYSFN